MLLDGQTLKRLEMRALAMRGAGVCRLLAPAERVRRWSGVECTGLRDYTPGDDYRHVDWMLCARRDEVLTRTFSGQCDPQIDLLLDCSRSMQIGRPAKLDTTRRTAAVLGYVALVAGYQVRVTAFSGRATADLPPLRGKDKLLRLLGFLESLEADSRPTDLARVATAVAGRYQRPGPVVVVSDLLDPAGYAGALDRLRARGYQPRIVQVYDPAEAEPTLRGELELLDAETQAACPGIFTQRVVERYRALFAQFLDSVRQYCSRHGLECVQLASDTTTESLLERLLGVGR